MPRRGPETHSSQPKDYPFKLKAALASLAVGDGCASPVFCGLVIGADAPKSFPKAFRGYVADLPNLEAELWVKVPDRDRSLKFELHI